MVCDCCAVVAAECFAGLISMIVYALRDLLALQILIITIIIWFLITVSE